MNSRLLPLWQNESLCKTMRMKMAHQVGTYSGFCSMYQLGVFLLPPSHPSPPPPQLRWDASPSQGYMYLSIYYLPVPIYPPDWKQAVTVK